jgi:hypothetical protein
MKKSYHLRLSQFIYILGFMFLITIETAGQTTSITINGGNQTMTITTGIADGQLVDVVNTSCTLTYSTNRNRIRKITVGTACPSQNFNLSVVATNVTGGTAQAEVNLTNGMASTDLIRDIPASTNNATCRLNYTASATFAQGNSTDFGNDVHTVTYTIVRQ